MYLKTLNHLICPVCGDGLVSDDVLSATESHGQQDITEGFLVCRGNEEHTYVVVDGVALLIEDLTNYLARKRNILPELLDAADTLQVKSFLADSLAAVDHLKSDSWESLYTTYIWAHYETITEDDIVAKAFDSHGIKGIEAFSAQHLMGVIRSLLACDYHDESVGLDIGCSVGGNTHTLAEKVETAIGCDYSFRAVRTARDIRDADGEFEYDAHLEGELRQSVSFDADLPAPAATDFVVTDATILPFKSATMDVVLSMNLVDVLANPLRHLEAGEGLLRPGGRLIVCDPYDWARVSEADPAHWFGGTPNADPTRSEAGMRKVITSHLGHDIVAEERAVPWTLKYHPRSYSTWIVDCIASEKPDEPS